MSNPKPVYQVPFNRATRAPHTAQYVADVLATGLLAGDGDYTKLCRKFLEQQFAVPAVMLTTSCTSALAWIHWAGRGWEKGIDEEKALNAGIIGGVTTPIGPSDGAPFQCSHHPAIWIVWGSPSMTLTWWPTPAFSYLPPWPSTWD